MLAVPRARRVLASAALVAVLAPACGGGESDRPGDVTTPGAPPTSVTPSVGPSGSLGHEHAEAPIDPDIALPASGFYARVEPSPATLPAGVLTDQGGVPFDMTDVTRGVDVGEITVDAEIRESVDDGMEEADEEM